MSGGGRDLCRSLLRSANIAEHYKKLRTNMKSLILYALRAYRWAISPLIGPACRYVPTCSEYAVEAVERYGAVSGGMRAAWRLLRCHPLALGGFDPVTREESRGTKVSVATGAKS